MKSICVITFYTPDYSSGYYSSTINSEYCKKNGYDFFSFSKTPNNLRNRHPAWCKFYYLGKVISLKKYDYVMWIDADAFFCNDEMKIEDWISNEKSNIFICRDAGFTINQFMDNKHLVNTGAMIFKNTDWSENLLHYLLINNDFKQFHVGKPWDQGAFQEAYSKNYNNLSTNIHVILDINFNNNTDNIQEYIKNDGFICHNTTFLNNKTGRPFIDKPIIKKNCSAANTYIKMKQIKCPNNLKYLDMQNFNFS